ncbi:MAG: flippase-like domain-containing protein [Deltaproteobacteria bacterium]|nr:flippase-like domain-containing protein [Deltaproteobacteria bacterium]MBI3077429.1 flippase-like domain-containing protein [Deltaproteobacteria bacterium]
MSGTGGVGAGVGRGRRWRGVLLKAGVSVLLLAVLLWEADVGRLVAVFGQMEPLPIIVALIFYTSLQFMAAFRWRVLLQAKALEIPYLRLVAHYYGGVFFNQFLPSSIGGDVYRGYGLFRDARDTGITVASLVLDRLSALAALLALSLGALAFMQVDSRLTWTVILLNLGFAAGVVALVPPACRRLLLRLVERLGWGRVGAVIQEVTRAIFSYWDHRRALGAALLLAFLIQVALVGILYLTALALHVSAPLAYFFLTVPLIELVTLLPISLGGVGLREGSFVFFFAQVGVPSAAALAISLSWFGMSVAMAGIGALVLLWRARRR